MDARRFDTLVRLLVAATPRRQILGSMVSALLGGYAVARQAEAGCKKVGKKCDKKCYDLDKDEQHCGNCNTACATGESCVAGTCAEGGCTANLDSCASSALCTPCPDRAESVCYLDDAGQARCSRVILCFDCESDASCEEVFGTGARCIACAGQCGSGRACAAG